MRSCSARCCFRQSSSTRASSSFEIIPASKRRRASFHAAGRSRLPTTSVRMVSRLLTLDPRGLHRGGEALEVFTHEARVVLRTVLAQLHAEVRHALGQVALA